MLGKKVLASLFVSLFVLGLLVGCSQPVQAAAIEPKIVTHGIVQKDITNLSDIMQYVNEKGTNATLPYQGDTTKNITIDPLKIELEENRFLNASLDGTSYVSSGLTLTKDLLHDTSGISYLLLKVTNSSDLTNDTQYDAYVKDDVNIQIDNNYYILAGGLVNIISGNVSSYLIRIIYYVQDSFANEYQIFVFFGTQNPGQIIYSSTLKRISVYLNNSITHIYHAKIQDILTAAGLSLTLTKITAVQYQITFSTPASGYVSDNYEIAGMFYYASVTQKLWEINSVIVNATTNLEVQTESSLSSTIGITKIADARIPFVYEPVPKKNWNTKELTIVYDWSFTIPDDSALSFSDVYLNYTIPSGNITQLLINGEDYLDKITEKAGEQVTLITNMSVGSYMISNTIKYTSNDFDAIIAIEEAPYFNILDPSSWKNFWAWVTYSVYNAIQAIAAVLGLTGTTLWALAKKREAKTSSLG